MTDGGNQQTAGPMGPGASWPGPPPGTWGDPPTPTADPSPPSSGSAPPPADPSAAPKRGGVIGIAVVALLTIAIVALAFTVIGGEESEPEASEDLFQQVGPIDSSVSGFDPDAGSALDDPAPSAVDRQDLPGSTGGLYDAVPTFEDIQDLLDLSDGRANLVTEDVVGPGPIEAPCRDATWVSTDGVQRVWSLDDSMSEIEIRVEDMGSTDRAREVVEERQDDAFATCLETQVETSDGTALEDVVLTDSAAVTTGDQLEQVLLFDDGDQTAIYAWRQVDEHLITIKAFDFSWGENGDDLAVTSVDDLLALTTEGLGG